MSNMIITKNKFSIVSLLMALVIASAAITGFNIKVSAAQKTVTFTVNTTAEKGERKAISPYIYGINGVMQYGVTQTAARAGGNRWTGYNWVNNYSSAGSDWRNFNDTGMGKPSDGPAAAIVKFVESANDIEAYQLVTVPMAGYVANDGNDYGDSQGVPVSETAPSKRFAKIQDIKGSTFTLNPSATSKVVYTDELINFLVAQFGLSTTETGIKGYSLDNEPGLWSETHSRIHPEKVTIDELVSKSVSTSKAIKSIDPKAEVFGGVLYGFEAYRTLQGASDWSNKYSKSPYNYKWFIDCYLDLMKKESDKAGKRLVDVFDIHYYSEAQDANNKRVSFGNETTSTAIDARVQAPRTLIEKGYYEKSWIADSFKQYLPLIPTIQQSINKYNPGTKLAFTEWSFGAEGHISGGIADADFFGICGAYGVYFATCWPLSSDIKYLKSAINIYTDYDDNYGSFGDTSVKSTTDDKVNASIYSSIVGDSEDELHIILINKNQNDTIDAKININSGAHYGSGEAYYFDGTSANIKKGANITNKNKENIISYTLPALSVTHIILYNDAVKTEKANEANTSTAPEEETVVQPKPRLVFDPATKKFYYKYN